MGYTVDGNQRAPDMSPQVTSALPPAQTAERADLLIFDDILPCGFSPFRTVEYSHYLEFFNARLLSTEGWHLWLSNENFDTHLQRLAVREDLKERIVSAASSAPDLIAPLAYITFLNNAVTLLPTLTQWRLPFILQLYPGGGLAVDQPETDKKLRSVLLSDLCRKVIVTQRLTRDYIIDRIGCDTSKIEFIFGGVFESRIDFDFYRDKLFFGKDKNHIDLCFVAHKYNNDIRSKGYDQFVDIARCLAASTSIALRFHVVGDYSPDDKDLGDVQGLFRFYGRQDNQFFSEFYRTMDAIISVNRPFVLAPGAFDGFPTGACIEAGFHGVLNCINDPLDLNRAFTPGEDFVLLDLDVDRSAGLLRQLFDAPDHLYQLAYNNWRKFHDVLGVERQLWARTRLIAAELLRRDDLVPLPIDCGRRSGAARISELETEVSRLISAYRVLEGHYLAGEAERKRLVNYIRSRES